MNYLALSFYKLIEIDDPEAERTRQRGFIKGKDITCRTYISKQGINGQMSGSKEDAALYMEWLRSDERFSDVVFKIQECDENVFPRQSVKVRKELAAMGEMVDWREGGKHVPPAEWREMLESDEEYLKIDVRNDYEWDIGHFKGFPRPTCRTFRDFPELTRKLKEQVDPRKTKVMMCCTGGIRCEFYSAQMKKEGFEEVYQLEGGILAYGEQERGKHWDGKLFVFDDRLAVDVNPDGEVIGKCSHCGEAADQFYNCANMDCNDLFICCRACVEAHSGCCRDECVEGPRVRPVDQQTAKPFRRWYEYLSPTQRAAG